MNLSEKQRQIVEDDSSKIVVIAAAASGKTHTMVEKVRRLLRQGVNPKEIVVITFTNMSAEELRARLADDFNSDLFIGTIHSLANYFLMSAGVDTSKYLNEEKFDKLFSLVKKNPQCIRPISFLLLDEAQDSTPMEFEFIFNMIKPKSFMVVGDRRQCQPKGTKILMRDGKEKNIEDLQVGDEIVWYEPENGRCCGINGNTYNSKHKYVEKVEHHLKEEGYLITLHTENGLKTQYTEEHRTFIKMRKDTDFKHLVYLMCNDDYRFRVGKIPLSGIETKNGNPWHEKMAAEGYTKIWILNIFKTDKEARVYQQKISYKYQIPQLYWQTNKVQWTKGDIDYIYEGIDIKNNGIKCLTDHQLDINLPLVDKNIDWMFKQKFAINATSQIYAINIIPEVMDCLIYDYTPSNHSRKKFEKIIGTKEKIRNSLEVYSLQVEGGTYVADGIVTHNCIYAWRGSKPYLLTNLSKQDDVVTYDLNENYRNGREILIFAKRLIQPTGMYDTSVAMREFDGNVVQLDYNLQTIKKYLSKLQEKGSWAILTRTNKDANLIEDFLKDEGFEVDGFKQGQLTRKELVEKMESNSIKVLTIHSAKGLEWDYVFVVGAKLFSEEERCIAYVGATRARKGLVWMNTSKKKKKMYSWE